MERKLSLNSKIRGTVHLTPSHRFKSCVYGTALHTVEARETLAESVIDLRNNSHHYFSELLEFSGLFSNFFNIYCLNPLF